MRLTVGIKTGAACGVCVGILVAAGALSYRSATRFVELKAWVIHTYDVLENLQTILAGVLDAQGEARGYLIAGDRKFLDASDAAQRTVIENLKQGRMLTADNPPQEARFDLLDSLGAAVNSAEAALGIVEQVAPNVISLDIRLPGMDGLEATRRFMCLKPTPIVAVSAAVESDLKIAMRALEAGALAVLEKPVGTNHEDYEEMAGRLCTQLVIMSQVQVLRQHIGGRAKARAGLPASIFTLGVVMTGMGEDGAAGLLEIRRAGGYTIAEDPSTALVSGMPQAAVLLGAARKALRLLAIARRLLQLVARAPGIL